MPSFYCFISIRLNKYKCTLWKQISMNFILSMNRKKKKDLYRNFLKKRKK